MYPIYKDRQKINNPLRFNQHMNFYIIKSILFFSKPKISFFKNFSGN